jgi:hypothetical protein
MQQDINLLYESFVLSLGQEYEQYKALLKILKEESLIMKKSSLENILENNAQKEAIVISLNMASEIRGKAAEKIASYFNLDKPVSMTKIISHALDNTRQILLDYQEKFADVTAKVKKLNEDNKNMITFSLTHVRNTFNYINSLVATNPHYNHHGQIKAENLQGRLISQAG